MIHLKALYIKQGNKMSYIKTFEIKNNNQENIHHSNRFKSMISTNKKKKYRILKIFENHKSKKEESSNNW